MSAVGNSGNTPNIGAVSRTASNAIGASGIQARTTEGLSKIPKASDVVVASSAKHPAVGTGIATVEAALAALAA